MPCVTACRIIYSSHKDLSFCQHVESHVLDWLENDLLCFLVIFFISSVEGLLLRTDMCYVFSKIFIDPSIALGTFGMLFEVDLKYVFGGGLFSNPCIDIT